jgi:hypothetical protein
MRYLVLRQMVSSRFTLRLLKEGASKIERYKIMRHGVSLRKKSSRRSSSEKSEFKEKFQKTL